MLRMIKCDWNNQCCILNRVGIKDFTFRKLDLPICVIQVVEGANSIASCLPL